MRDHGLDGERYALSCHLMPWLIVEASGGIALVVSGLSVQCSSVTALENTAEHDWYTSILVARLMFLWFGTRVRLAGFADAC